MNRTYPTAAEVVEQLCRTATWCKNDPAERNQRLQTLFLCDQGLFFYRLSGDTTWLRSRYDDRDMARETFDQMLARTLQELLIRYPDVEVKTVEYPD